MPRRQTANEFAIETGNVWPTRQPLGMAPRADALSRKSGCDEGAIAGLHKKGVVTRQPECSQGSLIE